MAGVQVLMVAEKPSLAHSIARLLASGEVESRRGTLDVHEWTGQFKGRAARFRVTSVMGHVYSIDFPARYNDWERTDPESLFDAETEKNEANPKARVCNHLQREAKGCDYLVLWLDCDREGENICFEVMDNCVKHLRPLGVHTQQVFRARFSAISAPELNAAMCNLGVPNRNEALAVDARQELDLKMGVAFTRFQTRYFQGKYGNLDSKLISFGPCQTPTLGFCVERHHCISTFIPEKYWTIRMRLQQGGTTISPQWERGRIFDRDVCVALHGLVVDASMVVVTDVDMKEERKLRPPGLNTVEMLKVASSALNMGPHHAMKVAESLYIAGYLSYPRTESSAYPPNFDFRSLLAAQQRHPVWGECAAALLRDGFSPSRGGTDMGDHPPITPMRCATAHEVGGGDSWRLYDYVTRHFLASLSPDALLQRTSITLDVAGETFRVSGREMLSPGYTVVMPWRAVEGEELPEFTKGEALPLGYVELCEGETSPPGYLTESELITLMEKHAIGTDASIPTHIKNICERNYVQVHAGRRVVPTPLGITLIRGYQRIDPDLCLPLMRNHVERQIDLVAKGEADFRMVVRHIVAELLKKFQFFTRNISRMDELFQATFTSLATSGKRVSKCGICHGTMTYITTRPSRLYCETCEAVYRVPQGGTIKLYKELVCPLDGFELVLFTVDGPDGRAYPLCPYCFSHPPFEGVTKVWGGAGSGGMPCTNCTHPSCPHSLLQLGVCSCVECDAGTLVLDQRSAPKWRLVCNQCKVMVHLPGNAKRVSTMPGRRCAECSSTLLEVDFRRDADGSTLQPIVGCVVCDEALHSMIELKYGKTSFGGKRRTGGVGAR